jgi:hypothetical protein
LVKAMGIRHQGVRHGASHANIGSSSAGRQAEHAAVASTVARSAGLRGQIQAPGVDLGEVENVVEQGEEESELLTHFR